ncbi:hypothetical protein FHS55_003739 [Angulomicrobium tetraedrale]|uniref:Uncharacterized protein n=1 Tax=Ancylobacter tetraedralis TaxID=217068 RepID=A0A839ZEH6_9HYPH|nr:hypothetical protein [Ancylobacter tetraedralis]
MASSREDAITRIKGRPAKCLIRLNSLTECCSADSELGKTIVSDVNLLCVSLRIL